jgi:hypothetical protein
LEQALGIQHFVLTPRIHNSRPRQHGRNGHMKEYNNKSIVNESFEEVNWITLDVN